MAHRPVGIILTAGFGTRLRPLTWLRPKPIMEIAGRPIIYFLIRALENAGVKDIFLNLHHHGEHIRHYVEQTNFTPRIHLVYEKEILGTAGGVRNIIATHGLTGRKIVVIHGDIMADVDLCPSLSTEDVATLICARDHAVPGYVGSVGVDGDGHIVELGRYFTSTVAPRERGFFTGIQVLSSSAVELLLQHNDFSLVGETYARWLKNNLPITCAMQKLLYDDLGTAQRIFAANMAILNGRRFASMNVLEGLQEIRPGIFCGEGVHIARDAELVGPLIIAAHARIEAFAQVGPMVVLGERSVASSGARVSNSVVFADTTVEKDEKMDCALALTSVRVKVKPNELLLGDK